MLSADATKNLEQRKRVAQRVLCRRKRGSRRYAKQRRRIARISAKLARIRSDWRHKATLSIANRFGLVAIEALNVSSMSTKGHSKRKRSLNRSIREQGWGEFERVLNYKLEERGGTLIKVNPAYTSQECSACGTVDKASRESQSSYACRHCGFADHADTNAAKVILRRGTALTLVEGSKFAPDETRTINLAA
jgi:putative transposase